MSDSIRSQIQRGFGRIITRYTMLSGAILACLVGLFLFYNSYRNLQSQSDLVRTQLRSEITATLNQAETLVESPILWSGLMDSFSHDTVLKPLFEQLNRLEYQRFILLDYRGRVSIEAPDVSAAALDLAREALTRRSGLTVQLNDLHAQLATLQDQEEKLTQASQRLQAKVEAFRTKKETIKATYSAAEAQTKINEAFSGISEELGDVGLAIQRAEDKTQAMQARAGAIDELIASGALEDATGTSKDSITAELERMASTNEVEDTLAQMKAEISGGSTAPAVEAPAAPAVEAPPAEKPEQA